MFGPKSKKLEQSISPIAEAAASYPESKPPICEPSPAVACHAPKNVIGKGTVIQGNVIAEGDLLIEGTVRGDVTTKTNLVIGPTCIVEGNILAEHAEVAGQVKGTVQALGLLVIKSSSMIDGDVLTKNLNVESGSTFNGRFTVGSVSTSSPRKADTLPAKSEANVLPADARKPGPAVATPVKV